MKPMLPSLTFDLSLHPDWLYEVKYDGFRAILEWSSNGIEIISRNGKPLLPQFPEIKEFLVNHEDQFKSFLPIKLDGELVSLENPYKSNFSAVQVRGRLKSAKKITESITKSPCHLMVFDILMLAGKNLSSIPFDKRKKELTTFFKKLGFQPPLILIVTNYFSSFSHIRIFITYGKRLFYMTVKE